MAETWPTELQDILNEDSFSFNFGETAVRSDMEIGPAKVRRRFTRGVDTVSCSIDLTVDQYSVLKFFYNTTLNGGVNQFTFNHPITGAETDFRMTKAPSIRSLGGGYFRASMEWELIPA